MATTKDSATTMATVSKTEELKKTEEAAKIYNWLKVAMALTDVNGLAKSLSPYDFETRFVSIGLLKLETPLAEMSQPYQNF